jgi:cytochrome c oxidase subunit 2
MLMLAQALGIPLFPEQASVHARNVDHLFFYLLGVTGGVALLVCLLLVGFSIRYRRRTEDDQTPRITGWALLEWSWTLAPLLFFASMFGWGLVLYTDNFRPPPDAFEIFVVGKQWMWKVQHQGGQREINELHVPVDRPVKLTLISEDVIHDFSVPAFRMKIDVLPGRYVSTWFQPTKTGRFHLFCNQYCGTGHAQMLGTVTVLPADEYESWLREKAEGSSALEGRKLFLKHQCLSCHSADPEARAPVLEALYGRLVPLRGGRTTRADRDYIRESILYPAKQVVAGWEPIMPTFRGQLTEEELLHLVAYIESLQPGKTPKRNDASPAPVGTPGSGKPGETPTP